jgi:YfiH family protein
MFKVFDKYPDLVIAFSEKQDGPMKNSAQNRERFFEKLGIAAESVARAGLVHKNKVAFVSQKDAGRIIGETDGLITKDKNLFLSITTADCLPIFIYNPEKKIIALVHCGWRSLALGILKNAIGKIGKGITAGIGPGISSCHFEVRKYVFDKFKPYLKEAQKGSFLDLKKVAEMQLIDLGVKKENIEISEECTYCLKDKYFSYRREGAGNLKTMIAVFGRK